jgi:very-short-patch-repair endonuclease
VLAALGGAQHGVVGLWQLLGEGISRDEVRWRAKIGRLHPLHRGVYAVGHTNVSGKGRVMAAVLAYGPRALASHRTCGWIWNVLSDQRARIDVTIIGRSRSSRPGITLHRPRRLADEDRTTRDGIPCTSVARMLLDVAATEPLRLLRRAFEEAERQRVLDMRDVERVLASTSRHRGIGRLATLAQESTGPPPMTRSDLERAFLDLVRSEGLPMPAMNVPFGDYELDAVWLDRKVAVEIDHYRTHGHRTAFERDRVRDIELQIAGFRTGRVTDVQIANPDETGPRLRRLLRI